MSNAALAWIEFLISALLIAAAGARLARYGDIIAEKTGVGGTWIGLVLLASVTSLPELVTGISAVTIANAPDIALGDVMGSLVFNLAILAVIDFLYRDEPIYARASQGHILSAGFGVILIGFVGFSLLLAQKTNALALGHIGFYTPLIIVLYLLAMRILFVYERRQLAEFAKETAARYPQITLRHAAIGYALAGLVVVAAAVSLPFIGNELAEIHGWHSSFVGTLFIAGATSLPELVVTLAALRLGALDMAIGNLLGSNLFDVLIIAIDDLFFLRGPLLSHVSEIHAVTALSAMIMTGAVIVGLIYRPRTRLMKTVGWVSLSLLAVYILNVYILYLYGT